MIKKLLSATAMLDTVLGGVVAAAPSASAMAANTPAGTYCRGATTPDSLGVSLDPCAVVPGSDPSTINALIGIDSNGRGVDPCAQLVDIDTGQWATNYQCVGWINTGNSFSWYSKPAGLDFGQGTYVVQMGYWAYNANGALQYFDNAQSPRIVFGLG